jgi:hypothetical protein
LWPCSSQPPSTRSATVVDANRPVSLPISPPCAKMFAATRRGPSHAVVTKAAEVGGHARPVVVHVDRHGRRGGVVGETLLQAPDRCQIEAGAPALHRESGEQVAAVTQLGEVLVEEAVLAVVHRGPGVEAGEHVVGQDRRRVDGRSRWGHGHLLLLVSSRMR